MKNQLLSFCLLFVLLVSCNNSYDFTPKIDVTTIHTVDSREQLLKIPVTSNTDWVLIKESNRWCMPDKSNGSGNDMITLRIAENIDHKARKISIGVGNPSVSRIIQIVQQATTEEYHYKLPVIFHIFYDDPSNPEQNIAADVIAKTIEGVNAYYRKSVGSVDMNLEFVLATHDPQGILLKEPGIERIYSTSPTETSYQDFMIYGDISDTWDLNRYINVFAFPFIEQHTLGAASSPFTIGYDALAGLYNGDRYVDYPTVDLPHGIALNNHYALTEHSVLKVPDMHITLAHELGHYLGLFHTFDEDYCDDTETYDREAYEKLMPEFPRFEEAVKRMSHTGTPFVSYNHMDYDCSYLNQFTPEQRKRVRHVVENSPLIPGPKHTDYRTRDSRSTEIPKQRFIE